MMPLMPSPGRPKTVSTPQSMMPSTSTSAAVCAMRLLLSLLSEDGTRHRCPSSVARFSTQFRPGVGLRVDRHAVPEDQLAAEPAGDRNQDDTHDGEREGDGVAAA